MRADFGALFQDANRKILAGIIRQLLELYGGAQTGGTTADYHQIIRH